MGESECPCMRDALGCPGPTVKSDIIARKANQAASQILFRLYTTHQPEGNRGTQPGVEQLAKSPCGAGCSFRCVSVEGVGTVVSKVHRLWYEFAGPNGVGGRPNFDDKACHLQGTGGFHGEPRWSKVLQLHGRPSEEAVKSYHKHLLAEFETLAGAQVAKMGGSSNLALKSADASGDRKGEREVEPKVEGMATHASISFRPGGVGLAPSATANTP